ncbi:MAG: S-adenosylmethionine:tRNA ribosyltransferase-isomerase [Cryomorphaceae bacterium]|nr:S-adenosylmethionine:tRNA ribosyltransferase-isomerase [Cryomorphaceae bacterium]
MMNFSELPSPHSYDYHLPENRIAFKPLEKRDDSRLLVYSQGQIDHRRFYELPALLPANSRLFFNETKVVMARLHALVPEKNRLIEIFCLEAPKGKSVEQVMQSKNSATFYCLVGGARHWKSGTLNIQVEHNDFQATLELEMLQREEGKFLIGFAWQGDFTFAEILDAAGKVPLPPYIRRDVEESDSSRYQTVYAKQKGSVAAPTAGLHFTQEVMQKISERDIHMCPLVLHVGGGTFLPLKAEALENHIMHAEEMVVTQETIEAIQDEVDKRVAVGTTSVRYLETLYWLGVKCIQGGDCSFLDQWAPYTLPQNISLQDSMRALYNFIGEGKLYAKTSMMIIPGYRFRVVDGLVTNFHQPKSTLLMLVAAVVGADWKRIYQEALDNGYRFLSYGDSNLYWVNG